MQPPHTRHNEVHYADDLEMLELVAPADFGTEETDAPADLARPLPGNGDAQRFVSSFARDAAFETGLRAYFAYRDLDAKIAARDTALDTWRRIYAMYKSERRGGEAEKEAQAREQYFRYEEEVQNALAGQPLDGTRTYNGSSGGTFRGIGGVQTCERRLRLLLGLPMADGALLRPVDEPIAARVAFDWQQSVAESLSRRVELQTMRL